MFAQSPLAATTNGGNTFVDQSPTFQCMYLCNQYNTPYAATQTMTLRQKGAGEHMASVSRQRTSEEKRPTNEQAVVYLSGEHFFTHAHTPMTATLMPNWVSRRMINHSLSFIQALSDLKYAC